MARKPKIRAPYKMVSPATWALARAAYLGGKTAAQVAEQFDIGLQNLRQNIYKNGWSKRALADALADAAASPGVPPPPDPLAAARGAPKAKTAAAEDDLLAEVLRRARQALVAGRGGEASALLKAAREYVIVQQVVTDARDAIAAGVGLWDAAQPARAGEVTERLLVQTLHDRWSGLSEEALADRADPGGIFGLKAFLNAVDPPDPPASRKAPR